MKANVVALLAGTLILCLAIAVPVSAKRWHAHHHHHAHHVRHAHHLHHAHRLRVGSASWWRWMDRAGRGGRQQP